MAINGHGPFDKNDSNPTSLENGTNNHPHQQPTQLNSHHHHHHHPTELNSLWIESRPVSLTKSLIRLVGEIN